MEIEEHILLDLVFWARRYCDGRSTYAPSAFNQLYDKIVQLNPLLKEIDKFDDILMNQGEYWPYAQDGMFKENSGSFDARPRQSRYIMKCVKTNLND